jgi:hypothetical protein
MDKWIVMFMAITIKKTNKKKTEGLVIPREIRMQMLSLTELSKERQSSNRHLKEFLNNNNHNSSSI